MIGAPCGGLIALLLALPLGSNALADDVVASGNGGTVTAAELRLVLSRLPEPERARLAGSRPAMDALLRDMLLQDGLFAAAHAAGIDRQPDVALEAERARQGVVVRDYILRQLPALPAPDAARIEAAYAANRSHFMQPRQFHLAQIFLAGANGDAVTALAHLLDADPGRFAALARARSQDRRSAASGGDLGWLAQDNLAEPIRSAVAGLPVGGISAPLQTEDGWHLIRLLETRPAAPASLDAVRATLVEALAAEDRAAAMRRYVADVAGRVQIRIDAGRLARVEPPRP